MEALTFFSAMNRGQFREEQGIEGSSYCIFFAPMEELVTQDRMTGREDRVVLELLYGDEMLPGALRVRQVGSNAVVEESTQGAFRAFLEEKPVKYIGQLLMYALQFKIQDLSLRIWRTPWTTASTTAAPIVCWISAGATPSAGIWCWR